MADQINTIIVLRNDSTTAWADSSYKLLNGELGVGYMTRALEDGTQKQVPIIKLGDGVNVWKDLPQAEGVFEQDVILTSPFGKYTIPASGYVNAGGTGMTTSEWLKSCLSEVKEPAIKQPSVGFSASATTSSTEIGSNITALNWNGSFTDGSYQYGTTANASSKATGLTASDVAWVVKNGETQIGTTEDGKYTLTSANYIQIDTDGTKTYATLAATATLDATNARIPLNNVGTATTGQITAASAGSPWTKTANVNVTGYRKPFWAVLTTPYAEIKSEDGATVTGINITSNQVRALANSGSQTKGLPTSLAVAEGSRQVLFCAKAGTYNSLTATDAAAQNATVAFTKLAKAVKVEGANGFEAVDYDIFEVTWGDPIASAKSLNLSWK